jgi:hypothetical protein
VVVVRGGGGWNLGMVKQPCVFESNIGPRVVGGPFF